MMYMELREGGHPNQADPNNSKIKAEGEEKVKEEEKKTENPAKE